MPTWYNKAQTDLLLAAKATLASLTKSSVGLTNVDNTSDVSKPISTAAAAALAAKADLVGGFIPTSQIPALALNTVATVASRAAMLALTSSQVQPGDVAVDTSAAPSATRGSYMLLGTDPSVIGNWVLLNAPTDAVGSVNGQTGTVVLAAADIGAAPATLAATVAGNTTAIGQISLSAAPVALSAAGTMTAGAPNLLDATAGAFTATLPTPARVGQLLMAERVDTSLNLISFGGTIRGVAAAANLPGLGVAGEAFLFVAETLTSWRIAATHKPNALLAAQYARLGTDGKVLSAQLPSSSGGSGTGTNPSDIGYDIWLLAGQSNVVGDSGGAISTLVDVTDPRVWQFPAAGSSTWQIIQGADPLYHLSYGAGSIIVGPGMEFARWYLGSVPSNRRILLVPAGYSGTAILSGTMKWDPTTASPNDNNNLYNLAIAQVQAALATAGANARIAGVLWVQGESDVTGGATAANYRTAFEYLIDGLRSRLSLPNLPFVIGSMVPEFIANNGAAANAIDAVHAATPSRKAYTAFVRGPSGLSRGDSLHYSPTGQRVQGRALLGGYLAALANSAPANAVAANPPTPPAAAAAPGAPTGLTATANNGGAALSWTAPVSNGGSAITDYIVQYSSNAGSTWTTFADGTSTATSTAVTGLTNGTAYSFRVATVNAVGTSNYSTTVTATPAAPASITDNFNRTATTTGLGTTTTGGQTWQEFDSTWGITSDGKGYNASSSGGGKALVDLGSMNMKVKVTYGGTDGGSAIVFRATGNSKFAMLLANGTLYNFNGSFTQVGTFSNAAASTGDVIEIDINGTAGTILKNGTQVGTFTDSTNTGTKAGLRADSSTPKWDDFSITGY